MLSTHLAVVTRQALRVIYGIRKTFVGKVEASQTATNSAELNKPIIRCNNDARL